MYATSEHGKIWYASPELYYVYMLLMGRGLSPEMAPALCIVLTDSGKSDSFPEILPILY